ncbi:MAG: DNA methyltransferase [Candidatus Helarchaeales archaeon]
MSEDWDFQGANTKYLTHGLHYYPARMIPQIARRLILRYSKERDFILDPFVGSGTTLVEARLAGRDAIGIDVNPFSVLLTRVKSTPITGGFQEENVFLEITSELNSFKEEKYQDYYPKIKNVQEWLEKWFPKQIIKHLLCIKKTILESPQIQARKIRDFYKIIFSKVLLDVFKGKFDGSSTHLKKNTRKDPPDPLFLFKKYVQSGINIMQDFANQTKRSSTEVVLADFCEMEAIKLPAVDMILTSPPYGEERNTIGYGRWTKFILYWLDYSEKEVRSFRKKTLGGQIKQRKEFDAITLQEKLNILEKKGVKHLDLIYSFFQDYEKCLKNMARILKPERFCCLVCGNRRVAGEYFLMDKITTELAAPEFEVRKVFHRNIPTKTIPWRGISGNTMKKENIIILKRT